MKMRHKATPKVQVPLFVPKVLKPEDVDWLQVFGSKEFEFIGLCDDPERRKCYGKPVLVDPVAAPAQGLPFVMELKTQPERELNDLLWSIEVLSQREHSFTARMEYQWAVTDPDRGREAITPEAHFEVRVRRYFEAGIYPKWSLSAIPQPIYYQPGGGPRNEFGDELPDELTRFHHLDFVSKVIYGMEQHVRWIRQTIYFERLLSRDAAEQRAEYERTLNSSQKYWGQVDELREAARLRQLQLRREAPELLVRAEPESEFANQLALFD